MAIDTTSMNSAKSYVRIARGEQTAAYIHKDHMGIGCEDEDTVTTLVDSLKELHSGLTITTVRKPGKKPVVRIHWA